MGCGGTALNAVLSLELLPEAATTMHPCELAFPEHSFLPVPSLRVLPAP